MSQEREASTKASKRPMTCKLIFWAFLSLSWLLCPAFAEDCNNTAPVGVQCTEEPSCVIVGETHMLQWKSHVPSKIMVICIHGLGLCARAYKPLSKELSEAGIDGFGVNVRGFGPDRDKPERAKLDCVATVGDIQKLLTSIHKDHPDFRVFLIGESMGGAIALRVAVENPELVDGVVCSAPAWKLLRMSSTAAKGIVEIFMSGNRRTGPAGRAIMRQATSNEELTQHWLADPSHKLRLSLSEARSFVGFISKTDNYAKRLTKPVLIVQGLNDNLLSPRAAAKIFKFVRSPNKTFLIDGTGEHLILEEAQFSPAVIAELITFTRTTLQSKPAFVSVNDKELSPQQRRELAKLLRISGI